jgi:hypothetical protein
MSIVERIAALVRQEFSLQEVDLDGTVANIVAASGGDAEPAVPLLTSIDDRRQVATLRALHAGESTGPDLVQRAALEPFVADWKAPTRYAPRIIERSDSPSSYYRLAVTESGINGPEPDPLTSLSPDRAPRGSDGKRTTLGLLWIGLPVGGHAGLLVLSTTAGRRDPVCRTMRISHDLESARCSPPHERGCAA